MKKGKYEFVTYKNKNVILFTENIELDNQLNYICNIERQKTVNKLINILIEITMKIRRAENGLQ